MIYGLYKNVRNAVWQVFIDFNITELPVSVNHMARQLGVTIIKNSDIHKLQNGERGMTVYINQHWYIVFDDNESVPICRFTVAHELGHILLGHIMTKTSQYRTFTVKNETEQSASYRAERMAVLEKRNKWYSHSLEKQVYRQFEDFIEKYR